MPDPSVWGGPSVRRGPPGWILGGKVPSRGISFVPMVPVSHLLRACASSLRGVGSRPGGHRAVCDLRPVPAAPGLCCNPPAAPLAFPSPLPRSSPDAAPHPPFPRAAPLLPSSARRCAAGPALPHPRDGGSGVPRPCLYRGVLRVDGVPAPSPGIQTQPRGTLH